MQPGHRVTLAVCHLLVQLRVVDVVLTGASALADDLIGSAVISHHVGGDRRNFFALADELTLSSVQIVEEGEPDGLQEGALPSAVRPTDGVGALREDHILVLIALDVL